MRRSIALLAAVVVTLFLLSGCEELLTFNAFSDFGQPDYTDATTVESSGQTSVAANSDTDGDETINTDEEKDLYLTSVQSLTTDDRFYEELDATGEENKQTVINTMTNELKAIYEDDSGSTSKDDRQRAAVLAANVQLKSSGADKVVNSLEEVTASIISGGSSSGSEDDILNQSVSTIVNTLNSFADDADFEATVSALRAAAEAYTVFGETLTSSSTISVQTASLVTAKEIEVPESVDIALETQPALVSMALDAFYEEYVKFLTNPVTGQQEESENDPQPADVRGFAKAIEDGEEIYSDVGTDEEIIISDLLQAVIENLKDRSAFVNILEASGLSGLLPGDSTQE